MADLSQKWRCRECGRSRDEHRILGCAAALPDYLLTAQQSTPLTERATPGQIERANRAVEVNMIDGLPRYESAQGYACALTAIMQTDAALASIAGSGQGEGQRAVEILNRHCEYVGGLARGQRYIGMDQALAAVREALAAPRGPGSNREADPRDTPQVDEVLADLDAMGEDLVIRAATVIRLMRKANRRLDDEALSARAEVLRLRTGSNREAELEATLLNDIAVMMNEFVENWPRPKRIDIALALVAKTLRVLLATKESEAIPDELAGARESFLAMLADAGEGYRAEYDGDETGGGFTYHIAAPGAAFEELAEALGIKPPGWMEGWPDAIQRELEKPPAPPAP